jgi:hypothetical protein
MMTMTLGMALLLQQQQQQQQQLVAAVAGARGTSGTLQT